MSKIKSLFYFTLLISVLSCSKEDKTAQSGTNKVLMLKVDYLTNTFEGGTEFVYPTTHTNSFTVVNEYIQPGDVGSIKLTYQEQNEVIFDGGIIWAGLGEITFPQNILDSNQFTSVTSNGSVSPAAGFENVFNPYNRTFDYTLVWNSIERLEKVREYLQSNPNGRVKLFLYTPSVAMGNPAEWDWIIFLKN